MGGARIQQVTCMLGQGAARPWRRTPMAPPQPLPAHMAYLIHLLDQVPYVVAAQPLPSPFGNMAGTDLRKEREPLKAASAAPAAALYSTGNMFSR